MHSGETRWCPTGRSKRKSATTPSPSLETSTGTTSAKRQPTLSNTFEASNQVENLITLNGRASAFDTKTRIKNAIARQAALDAERILVEVDVTEVTLTGRVASWNERKSGRQSCLGLTPRERGPQQA